MEYILEIIYLINKGWGTCNKFWWVFWYWNSLDCFDSLNSNVTYFDSFGVEHIPKEIKKNIDNKNIMGSAITKNIFRIQALDSVMCAYFCIGFIDFML